MTITLTFFEDEILSINPLSSHTLNLLDFTSTIQDKTTLEFLVEYPETFSVKKFNKLSRVAISTDSDFNTTKNLHFTELDVKKVKLVNYNNKFCVGVMLETEQAPFYLEDLEDSTEFSTITKASTPNMIEPINETLDYSKDNLFYIAECLDTLGEDEILELELTYLKNEEYKQYSYQLKSGDFGILLSDTVLGHHVPEVKNRGKLHNITLTGIRSTIQ